MASLKPTMSSDGLNRATVQVSHRIDIDALAVVAAHIMRRRGSRRVTKKELEDKLRFELSCEGQNGINEIDRGYQVESETWRELKSYARDQLLRLYPEFQDYSRKKKAG